MHLRAFVTCLSLGLCVPALTQEDNPTINYTTPAVRASVALDAIARLADKKIRAEPPLNDAPLILRLRNSTLSDSLDWIATVLHGTWEDRDRYKILRRTAYKDLLLRNTAQRARSAAFFEVVERRVTAHGGRSALTKELAAQAILELNKSGADKGSEAYQAAWINSADVRLIDRMIVGLNPAEMASAPFPDHIAISNKPKPLQYQVRLGADELAKIVWEQNLWTSTLVELSRTHKDLIGLKSMRRMIDPADARLLMVLSNSHDAFPGRVDVKILDKSGQPYVLARDVLDVAPPKPLPAFANDWEKMGLGEIQLSPLSSEFLANSLNPATPSAELKEALLSPAGVDPLQFVVSDGLLAVAQTRNWNLVASPPDETLLDPVFAQQVSGGNLKASSFLRSCEKTSAIEIKNGVMMVLPLNPPIAERRRSNRQALQAYAGAVARSGYSPTLSEASFVYLSGSAVDVGLAQRWATLLSPLVAPFIGSSVEALAFYGSLTPAQKRTLLQGYTLGLGDLKPPQKLLLVPILLNSPDRVLVDAQTVGIAIDRRNPEITELVDSRNTPGETVSVQASTEKVVRIRGLDATNDLVSFTGGLPDAASWLATHPLSSSSYSIATSNTLKLTLRASEATNVVRFIREYPGGFSVPVSLDQLPPEIRRALVQPSAPVKANLKPSGAAKAQKG
ncbi:MAG: hypothetical protein QOJ65_1574 [Fimbriimonadaceae bacterium]|jgi:hypothetical protein|nr:hypothetical protein [Fimbriimonadaceae bacterium]